MSYRIEQNDNDTYILHIICEDFMFVHYLRQKCYKFSEKIKLTKNVPVQVIFTGKIFYRYKSMNSIVGDGDRLYREQWNISGDRRVSIVLRD